VLKVIIFIFHNLEKVLVRHTGAFHYKRALLMGFYAVGNRTIWSQTLWCSQFGI